MRNITFGTYNTWSDWGLTLTGYKLDDATYKSSFVSVPGRDGDLDLSAALTGGEPRFNSRALTATFELSAGTRDTRLTTFSQICNALEGRRVNIVLPDDATHYITGRCHVAIDYCDPAHGALTITANCDPWRLASTQRTVSVTAESTPKTATLTNSGRRLLVPTVVITGTYASFALTFGEETWTLSAGTYQLPDLQLQPGSNTVTYSGTGTAVFTYREAIL